MNEGNKGFSGTDTDCVSVAFGNSNDYYSVFTRDWTLAGRMEVLGMMEESCGKPASWEVKGEGYGPVNLCEAHHAGAEIMKLVNKGALVMERIKVGEKTCQYVIAKREGPGTFPRASKRLIFG